MKPSKILGCALFAAIQLIQTAGAQSLDEEVQHEKVNSESAAKSPCLRAYCGNPATLAPAPASQPTLAQRATKDLQRSANQEWDEHVSTREHDEDYNCLLSFGFGGELRANGYQGARVLGQTRTLRLSGTSAPTKNR